MTPFEYDEKVARVNQLTIELDSLQEREQSIFVELCNILVDIERNRRQSSAYNDKDCVLEGNKARLAGEIIQLSSEKRWRLIKCLLERPGVEQVIERMPGKWWRGTAQTISYGDALEGVYGRGKTTKRALCQLAKNINRSLPSRVWISSNKRRGLTLWIERAEEITAK